LVSARLLVGLAVRHRRRKRARFLPTKPNHLKNSNWIIAALAMVCAITRD
jgi:hypothetical protein